ncbi:O-antigen ligase family protein [Stieleria sp. ICT_E10.1]|uniref:O-antigen ligase family protein n=1 Tax=Stieleria sedimenti TaxID=2976331 RepID=UPI00217F4B8C|nr:O-antigen ligase family protein [Stieleria sedimenti]MCS7465467.1 O-antigen ligase family protein [Stieleria sedimenti]
MLSVLAVLLALIPVVVSFDFGGHLAWTQYCSALAIVTLTVAFLALLAAGRLIGARCPGGKESSSVRQRPSYALLYLASVWVALLYCQTVPLSDNTVAWASGGSYDAYTHWLDAPLSITGPADRTNAPISIIVSQTRHAVAFLVMLLPLMWMAIELVRTRRLAQLILVVIAIGTSLHAVYGMACILFPAITGLTAGHGFGGFINRNNAALFMNLGLAASLGLALEHHAERCRGNFGPTSLTAIDWATDPKSWMVFGCVTLNLVGIMASGSRGGVLAMALALAIAIGFRARLRSFAVTLAMMVIPMTIVVIVVLTPDVGFNAIRRATDASSGNSIEHALSNARVSHWWDGLRASLEYLPMGSGLGTYGFAYLPFQSSGGDLWFQHADNLWLEVFVEQGVIGLLFVVAIMLMVSNACRRLQSSQDESDQAIGTMGLYVLVATAISQCLDFGLILSANAYLFAILASIVVTRSVLVSIRNAQSGIGRTNTTRKPVTDRKVVWGLVLAVLSLLSLPVLHSDAASESVAQRSQIEFDLIKLEIDQLRSSDDRIAAQVEENPTAALLYQQCRTRFQIARLREIESLAPESELEFAEAYAATRRGKRTVPSLAPDIRDDYLAAVDSAVQLASLNPLSINARAELIYLHFAHGDEAATRQMIGQLGRLQNRNPRQLIRLAEIAADHQDAPFVEFACRTASNLRIQTAPQAIDIALRCKDASLDQAVASSAAARRRAIAHALSLYDSLSDAQTRDGSQQGTRDRLADFMKQSLPLLQCDEGQVRVEKASCLRLTGLVAISLGDTDIGLDRLQQSTRVAPENKAFLLDYISQLRQVGRSADAKLEASRGRELFPEDSRFQRLFELIRSIESERLVPQSRTEHGV